MMTKPPHTPPEKAAIAAALISVSDKTGLVGFARALAGHGIRIISTGGTAETLKQAGVEVTPVAHLTKMPEMMGGRVKTLNPILHGGILARRDNASDRTDMETHGMTAIDLVVVNLYPFDAMLARPDAGRDALIDTIDIGGPALIRAAAKNHDFVTVITDSTDYPLVLEDITTGGVSMARRRRLAAKAFAHTARYDAAIAAWMRDEGGADTDALGVADEGAADALGAELTFGGVRQGGLLRYGENSHQQAGLYRLGSRTPRPGVLTAQQIQGKPLSYNNIHDTDAAFELVAEFDAPTVAIVKHANPCGVASRGGVGDAWDAALAADPVSAFGGIVALNRPLDAAIAKKITGIFTEVVIAPDADDAAIEMIAAKPDMRLLLTGEMPDPGAGGLVVKSVAGGFLAQSRDSGRITEAELRCVTRRPPDEAEMRDLIFAMRVAKHVKSNAIVYARGEATLGIGAGQASRIDASLIAARKAKDIARIEGTRNQRGSDEGASDGASNDGAKSDEGRSPLIGSVVASDAFFPFADGLMAAAEAGATAVIQPGGSIRDDEVIAAADAAGLAMVFTGMRHFRH